VQQLIDLLAKEIAEDLICQINTPMRPSRNSTGVWITDDVQRTPIPATKASSPV
jgi:hypothetical protein